MPPPQRTDVELLLAHTRWVPALARQLVRDQDLADELAQATWAVALEHGPRTTNVARLRAWLVVVAQNLARRMRKSESDRRYHEHAAAGREPASDTSADDELERVHQHKLLAESVLALDEPYRSTIALRFFSELDYDEIAKRQGVTNAAARQRVSRGLAMLRERLDRMHDGDRRAWCLALAGCAGLARRAPEAIELGTGGRPDAGNFAPGNAGLGNTGLGQAPRAALVAGSAGLAGVVAVTLWLAYAEPSRTGPEPVVHEGPASRAAVVPDDRNRSSLAPTRAAAGVERTPAPESVIPPVVDRSRDLHGVVLDAEGDPLAGARVVVHRDEARAYPIPDLDHPPQPEEVAETRTDDAGRFTFSAQPGRPYDLFVSHAAGRHGAAIVSNRYAGERVVVQLEPPAVLKGRVVRELDGSGVAGVTLRGLTDDNGFHTVLEGTTQDDGSFLFENLPACQFGLQVDPIDESPLPWIRVDLVGGETTTLVIPVQPGLFVSGQVTDAETGAPVEGATVGLGWRFRRPTQTDADGRYAIRGFSSAGHYEVHVRAPGYAEASRLPPFASKHKATIDLSLVRERRLTGRVLDSDGAPVVEAYVAAIGRLRTDQNVPNVDCRSTRTDADGRYEVRGLRPGLAHSLVVRSPGLGSVAYDIPAERTHVADILLQRGTLVRGTVVDASGRPLASASVSLNGTNADVARFFPERAVASPTDRPQAGPAGAGHVDRRRGRADDLGRFTFADVSPGTYRLLVSIGSVLREVSVTVDGLSSTHVVEPVALDAGLALGGRVLDGQGRPVGGAMITVRPTSNGGPAAADEQDEQHAKTGSDGSFRVHGLGTGAYDVSVRPDRWTASEETRELLVTRLENVQAGETQLALVCERGATIVGRLLDPSGRPVSRRTLVALDSDGGVCDRIRSRVDGSFTLIVEPGTAVDVLVEARGQETEPPVHERNVTAGATDLVLTLRR